MTAIAAAGATAPTTVVLPSALPAQTINSPSTSSSANAPAVVVSLSSAAQAASVPSLDPDKVNNALAWLGGADGFALIASHNDEAHEATQFGEAIARRNAAAVAGEAVLSRTLAVSDASANGVPFQTAPTLTAKPGSDTGPISVADFSFTSGGSTYAITNRANGTLLGTRDGQYWNSWQLNASPSPSDTDKAAETALQTLTALNTHKTSDQTSLTALDFSA